MVNKVILIVLDSVGIGELPDAAEYGDEGSNTLGGISRVLGGLKLKNMERLGLGNIDCIQGIEAEPGPIGCFGRCMEQSKGKDTITGHWEISGLVLEHPLKTYPEGFNEEIVKEFEKRTGKKVLANKVASGTEIIKEYGELHDKTGYPILYTSADSVMQIAANEEVIPLQQLYDICIAARKMMVGEWAVGRIIARPFIKRDGQYVRTPNRRDYALDPVGRNMLDYLYENKIPVFAVGKIEDIFNHRSISVSDHTKNNREGVNKTLEFMKTSGRGLIFTNLVDFDMLYGHRNDVQGYADALKEFDSRLPEIIEGLGSDDVLIITADHGCDPSTESTDHSREYIPLLLYSKNMKNGVNIGTRRSFCDIGKTVLHMFGIENDINGKSFYEEIKKG